MRIATFNVQNLRLRQSDSEPRLDGARDGHLQEDSTIAAQALDPIDRQLTARVLADADADVVALQEVFDDRTLHFFHDRFLLPLDVAPYPWRYCLPGNDGRGLDVALMSRNQPCGVISHAEVTPASLGLDPVEGCGAEDRIFRRDCLEVNLGPLYLYICHFKAPYPDREASWGVRGLEALAVSRLIEQRFPQPDKADWLIVGDLNEPALEDTGKERAIAPLTRSLGLDLSQRIPMSERWSYHLPHTDLYSKPDAMIASPALARRFPAAVPRVIRSGLDREASRYHGFRYAAVGEHRPHASDHAAMVIEFPGL